MTDQATQAKPLELALTHDTKKTLKGGKRRYSDADGHNLYLDGDEVAQIGSPDAVTLVVTAK